MGLALRVGLCALSFEIGLEIYVGLGLGFEFRVWVCGLSVSVVWRSSLWSRVWGSVWVFRLGVGLGLGD